MITAEHAAFARQAARSFARRLPTNIDVDDLAQVGLIAIHRWLPEFDAAAGVPLAAYLRTKMRGAMIDELRDADPLSRADRRQMTAVTAARSRLEHRLGRAPRASEVAAEAGLSLDDLHAFEIGTSPIQPEDVHGQSQPATPDEIAEVHEMFDALDCAFDDLTARERELLDVRFCGTGLDKDTAAALGLTRGRVSQICRGALDKLRAALG